LELLLKNFQVRLKEGWVKQGNFNSLWRGNWNQGGKLRDLIPKNWFKEANFFKNF